MHAIRTSMPMGLLFLFLVGTTPVHAKIGLAFSSGDGINDITPYRFAVAYDIGPVWGEGRSWHLDVLWETSFALWHGQPGPDLRDSNEKLNAITTGPLIRFQRSDPWVLGIVPYIEAGLGVSWLSKREIGGRKLSLHFQFEDNIGVGFRFGPNLRYDITYRLFHYSNASLKRPNSGVNIQMLSLGMWIS